jgi:hypothetical protein
MTLARRLATLEDRSRRQDLRAMAARIAAEEGIPVAELIAAAEEAAARVAAIGMDAYLEEVADLDGIPLSELRAAIGQP